MGGRIYFERLGLREHLPSLLFSTTQEIGPETH